MCHESAVPGLALSSHEVSRPLLHADDGKGDAVVADPGRNRCRRCARCRRPADRRADRRRHRGVRGTIVRGDARRRARPAIDPFVLSEPWRQLMQQAQGAGTQAPVDGRRCRGRPTQDDHGRDRSNSSNTGSSRRGRSPSVVTRSTTPSDGSTRQRCVPSSTTLRAAGNRSHHRRRPTRPVGVGRAPTRVGRPPQAAVGRHRRFAPVDPDPPRRARGTGQRGRGSAPSTRRVTSATSTIWWSQLEALHQAVEETRTA